MPSPRYRSPIHRPGWYRARQRAITPAQKRAERALWPLFGLTFYHDRPLDLEAAFSSQPKAPTVLEIGCGTGEALVELAAARRQTNFVGVDWFRGGLASCIQAIDAKGLDNVRLVKADAFTLLQRGLPESPLFDEVLVFFPDPWYGNPERLMMRPEVMQSLSKRLRRSALLHFASDVEAYPSHVRALLKSPEASGGRWSELPAGGRYRPSTKYERDGVAAGRNVVDLLFRWQGGGGGGGVAIEAAETSGVVAVAEETSGVAAVEEEKQPRVAPRSRTSKVIMSSIAPSSSFAAAAATATLRSPPPIPQWAIRALDQRGWCAVPNWLPDNAVAALKRDAAMCDAAGLPRSAGIGSTRSGETAVRQDVSVRISRMLPLYPPPSSRAGEVDTRIAFGEGIRSLGAHLEASLPWLPSLAPFRTELAYLFYPAGGLYKRHMDVPSVGEGWTRLGRSPEDGGSFSGAALRREVSMLLYLDSGWDAEWGGCLRVFEDGASEEEDESVDIVPEGGTLVLMRSDKVPHEVLETRRARTCVVGWFRTEGRAPE